MGRVSVQPLDYTTSGFKVEELVSEKFLAELKGNLPNALVAAILVGFTDSKEVVVVSHDRQEGKYVLDRVDIEGNNPTLIKKTLDAVEKVLG